MPRVSAPGALVVALLLAPPGCIDRVNQVAGVGTVYTTRCSAEMEPRGSEYTATCTPPACEDRFASAAINHVVVALEPNERVLGYAERVCLQDLSAASALFHPDMGGDPTVEAGAGGEKEASPEGGT